MPTFPSASGFVSIEASPLARPEYSSFIMSRVYEKDWLTRVTSARLLEPVTRCGQVIQIMLAPEVGKIRSYAKGQQLVPNTISTGARCLTISNLGYQDIALDSVDIAQACERWSEYESLILESIYESIVDTHRTFVLGRMMAEVSPLTSFTHAGKHHDINLGAPGAPVNVTPQNLPKVLADLQRALMEQLRWKDGEMFLIVPPILRTYLAMSNYSNSLYSCNCGGIVSGMWDHNLMGFQVIESVHVPVRFEADGRLCFYILAGHKDATAFASNIIESRVVETDPNTFSKRYQFLLAWGAEVIYPDALAMGYWNFNPIN